MMDVMTFCRRPRYHGVAPARAQQHDVLSLGMAHAQKLQHDVLSPVLAVDRIHLCLASIAFTTAFHDSLVGASPPQAFDFSVYSSPRVVRALNFLCFRDV